MARRQISGKILNGDIDGLSLTLLRRHGKKRCDLLLYFSALALRARDAIFTEIGHAHGLGEFLTAFLAVKLVDGHKIVTSAFERRGGNCRHLAGDSRAAGFTILPEREPIKHRLGTCHSAQLLMALRDTPKHQMPPHPPSFLGHALPQGDGLKNGELQPSPRGRG